MFWLPTILRCDKCGDINGRYWPWWIFWHRPYEYSSCKCQRDAEAARWDRRLRNGWGPWD